jgi:cytochrome c biogenesis protein CcdA
LNAGEGNLHSKKISNLNINFIEYSKANDHQLQNAIGWVFGGKICTKCDYLKEDLIPLLIKKSVKKASAFSRLIVIFVDLEQADNILMLMQLEKTLGYKGNDTPVLVWNDRLYYGNNSVEKLINDGENLLLACPQTYKILKNDKGQDKLEVLQKRASALKMSIMIGAGLIDGINPCVFSTLVFFMSLLSVSRIKGKKLIVIGTVYCISCFLTYLLLGFGALQILRSLIAFDWIRVGLNVLTVVLLGICALVSFYDAWAFSRSEDPNSVKLKLPDSIKKRINLVLKKGLKSHYLIGGAFFIGFFVTILESLCTGQVYVPVLVLLAKENLFSKWFFYLLIYNFAFIIPLIAVFAFTYMGISFSQLLKFSKKNVIYSKVMLGLLFIALTVLIILLEFVPVFQKF